MNLDRVTITGADNSVTPAELAEISREFQFVEWGILVSSSKQGSPRFPSLEWLAHLYDMMIENPHVILSFHVCGRWVREICAGNWTPLFTNTGPVLDFARRIQLNFHGYLHEVTGTFVDAAKDRADEHGWQIIFQCDGVNDFLVSNAIDGSLDAVPLYDKSGGAGILPDSWPPAMRGVYSGYAGGLGPENLAAELHAIAEAANDNRFWVDMETKVRSLDDQRFDLDSVRSCLQVAQSHVLAAT